MKLLGNAGKLNGHMFSCGMFGVCCDVVLSPTMPSAAQQLDHSSPIAGIASSQAEIGSGDDKENRVIEKQQRRLHRIPSSTQWELALKMHNRSLKSGSSDRISSSEGKIPGRFEEEPRPQLKNLISEVRSRCFSLFTLSSLRFLAEESEENRNRMIAMGLHEELIAFLTDNLDNDCKFSAEVFLEEEAFSLVLKMANQDSIVIRSVVEASGFSGVIRRFLQTGRSLSKIAALTLLVRLSEEGEVFSTYKSESLIDPILDLLGDREERVVNSGIKGLLALCLCKENRVAAVKSGAIVALFAVLGNSKGLTAERCLATLELLSTTSEGRAAIKDHALAVPMLLSMILRVSDRGTEYAAGILCSVCTTDNPEALETACRSRASTLLLLLLQSRCTERARRKALKLLKVVHGYEEKGGV